MINEQETFHFTQMPIVSGILLLIFGTFILTFALSRRNERRKITGISRFTCPDRMVNTKSTEKALRVLAMLLLVSGFILITVEALKIENQATEQVSAG